MKNNNRYLYIYYFILLLILLLRDSVDAPSVILRVAYLIAFLFPLIFAHKEIFPAILTCFMVVGTYGYAFNYMPYEMYTYFVMSLLCMTFTRRQYKYKQISIVFILALVLILLRNFFDSYQFHNIFYCVASVGIFALTSQKDNNERGYSMLYCFVIISLALSLLYLFNYERFIEDYNKGAGLERAGWIDPNYFSCIIGMGILSSIILMIRKNGLVFWKKLILVLTILLSFIAQVLMASRGGILAVSMGMGILIFFSNIKFKYKVLSVLLIVAFVIWMNANDYFTLLEYRIQNDDGTGSGRLDIWKSKFQAFTIDANVLTWLFGLGHKTAFELTGSGNQGVGFHNDFIAIFCAYGIVGLVVFLYWYIYPLYRSIQRDKFIVFAMLLYMVVVSMTLEPMSYGYLPYYSFFYTIILVSSGALVQKE